MEFEDNWEEGSFHYLLDQAFHYVPAGTIPQGEFKGEPYDEYWWRSCTLKDGEKFGTQGYLTVWFKDGKLTTHHTYRNPGKRYT